MGGGTVNEVLRIFGRRVRERRQILGIRQSDLAEACKLSRTSITNIEAGRQDTPLGNAHAIAAALGIPLGELISDIKHNIPADWARRMRTENEQLRHHMKVIANLALDVELSRTAKQETP